MGISNFVHKKGSDVLPHRSVLKKFCKMINLIYKYKKNSVFCNRCMFGALGLELLELSKRPDKNALNNEEQKNTQAMIMPSSRQVYIALNLKSFSKYARNYAYIVHD